jgi:hypothetical protein
MEKREGSHPCGGRGPKIAGRIARGFAIGILFALVFGLLVKALWNWLMPVVFGLREIDYAQAVGMIVLARVLFGIRGMRPGFGGGWHGRGHPARRGPCSGEDAANGQIRDWRKYDAWWEEEGREAFKKYLDARET